MSSAVVPFAQQGTVDWVALSNASAHFSIGVLARLSKAGIDPFTLQMGRAICADFTLSASVQQSLTDAIQKVKKYGSYGNVIWFGFGIKHIITDLSETEEGLACVSLCAALSTIYDNMYSAQVLRDLSGLIYSGITTVEDSGDPQFRNFDVASLQSSPQHLPYFDHPTVSASHHELPKSDSLVKLGSSLTHHGSGIKRKTPQRHIHRGS